MPRFEKFLSCTLLSILGVVGGAANGRTDDSDAKSNDRKTSFQRVVAPFFEKYCLDCHGPQRSKGGVTLHTLACDLLAGPGPKRWDKVLDQPKPEERRAVVAWIRGALRDKAMRVRAPAAGATGPRRPGRDPRDPERYREGCL